MAIFFDGESAQAGPRAPLPRAICLATLHAAAHLRAPSLRQARAAAAARLRLHRVDGRWHPALFVSCAAVRVHCTQRDDAALGGAGVVDEATTWASIGSDRHRRPGVSISLEAELAPQYQPPVAGDLLRFEAKVEKMGRTIGFQSCAVHDAADGRLVARGYHTKALDMGRAWNLLFGPPMLPLLEAAAGLAARERPMPAIDADDALVTRQLLAPTRTQLDAAAHAAALAYTCRAEHLQETSIMFGGLQAMVHEVAARAAAETVGGGGQPPARRPLICSAILVRYLAGAKLGDELEARAQATRTYHGHGVAATSRLSRERGATRSEAEVQFVAL